MPPAGRALVHRADDGPGLIVGHQDSSPYNAAVLDGDRLAGFFDWDTAVRRHGSTTWRSPRSVGAACSPRDGTKGWASTTCGSGPAACIFCSTRTATTANRGDFAAAVPQRARRQAEVIRHMADAGDAASTALLPIAELLERSATDIQALPGTFWTR